MTTHYTKETFWKEFKAGEPLTREGFDTRDRIRPSQPQPTSEFHFISEEGHIYPYNRPWRRWSPPQEMREVVLRAYAVVSPLGAETCLFFEDEQSAWKACSNSINWTYIGPATFNPADGTYSIKVPKEGA